MSCGDDAALVRDLVSTYAHAVDDRDIERIVGCFTDDTHVEYGGGRQVVDGRDALRSFFGGALTEGASTHVMSNVLVEIAADGDHAHAETQAVAFHAHAGRETVVIRGLRYSDDCVRTTDGWRIACRVHRPLWECTAPATAVRL